MSFFNGLNMSRSFFRRFAAAFPDAVSGLWGGDF